MKTGTKNLFLLTVLIAALGLIPAGRVTAQTFTTLHGFTVLEGAAPDDNLILWMNMLYGRQRTAAGRGDGARFSPLTAMVLDLLPCIVSRVLSTATDLRHEPV